MTAVATSLYCLTCGQEEIHEIHYAGRVMTSIACSRCGTTRIVTPGVTEQYVRDLGSRVVHKPRKMIREAMHDPRGFLLHLPGALVAKPAKLAAELEEVARAELAPWAATRLDHHQRLAREEG